MAEKARSYAAEFCGDVCAERTVVELAKVPKKRVGEVQPRCKW